MFSSVTAVLRPPLRFQLQMPTDQYHEPAGDLSQEIRTFARMAAALQEEAEAIGWYEQRLSLETESLHSVEERREDMRFALRIIDGLELLQPVHLASETPQPLDVLHVHPEMAAAVREVRNLIDGNDGRDHLTPPAAPILLASAGRS